MISSAQNGPALLFISRGCKKPLILPHSRGETVFDWLALARENESLKFLPPVSLQRAVSQKWELSSSGAAPGGWLAERGRNKHPNLGSGTNLGTLVRLPACAPAPEAAVPSLPPMPVPRQLGQARCLFNTCLSEGLVQSWTLD